VHDVTETACRTPWYAAMSASNWRTFGPTLIQPDLSVSTNS